MGYNNRQYLGKFLGNVAPLTASTSSGTLIVSGAGTFHGIVVGTTAASAFIVYDSAVSANAGTMMVLKSSIAEGNYLNIDASYANGLFVTYAPGGAYTVVYTSN